MIAGVVAGGIQRGTADLLGDKKIDTFRTKISTTGAFFGARGLARAAARYSTSLYCLDVDEWMDG